MLVPSGRYPPYCMNRRFGRNPDARHMTPAIPLSAGKQTSITPLISSVPLNLCLLSHFKRVVDLDAKISDGTFQFGMPEQQLNCPEVLGSSIYQRCLGSPERMSAIIAGVQTNGSHPGFYYSGILACFDMCQVVRPASEQK